MHHLVADTWGWGNLAIKTNVCVPTKLACPLGTVGIFLSKSDKIAWTQDATYVWGTSLLEEPLVFDTAHLPQSVSKLPQTLLVADGTCTVQRIDDEGAQDQINFPAEVTGLACGNDHALALDSHGRVYAWGDPKNGKLGLGNQTGFLPAPKAVLALEGIQVVQIACGFSHSLAVDRSGKVYTWGTAADGRLGHGDQVNRCVPEQVVALNTKKVSKVACGFLHSVVVTNTGEVLSFGFNGYGQLGLGNTENCLSPAMCYRLNCLKIVDLACGAFHTVCLGAEGSVYVMGLGKKGQLGLGNFINQITPTCLTHKFKPVHFLVCGPESTVLCGVQLDTEEFGQATSATTATELFEYFAESFETNFRPANLPAKDPQEAAVHKQLVEKQGQQYLERVKEQEREARRQREEKLRKEEQILENMKVWETDVLPNWDKRRSGKLVEELVYMGIPPKFRGRVWAKLAGNPQSFTQELFDLNMEKARSYREAPVTAHEVHRELIRLDASRTFSQNGCFQDGSPLKCQLIDLLEVFAVVRPDLGYVQGMSYLAGMLVINLDAYPAFVIFLRLVTSPVILPFYRIDEEGMQARYQLFRLLFTLNLPELCDHFETQGVDPHTYLLMWFTTIFARTLSQEVAVRIWDLFFLFGPEILFRTGLAVLKLLSYLLLPESLNGIMTVLRDVGKLISDADILVEQVQSIRIPAWVREELSLLTYETL